ncbi:MAG: hypothetical protein ACFFG0_04860 [Candidatus Thorarchaeota archaeon]
MSGEKRRICEICEKENRKSCEEYCCGDDFCLSMEKVEKVLDRLSELEKKYKELFDRWDNRFIDIESIIGLNFQSEVDMLSEKSYRKRIESLEAQLNDTNNRVGKNSDGCRKDLIRLNTLESVLKDIYFLMELGFAYPLTKGQFDEWWRLRTEKIKKLEGAGGNRSLGVVEYTHRGHARKRVSGSNPEEISVDEQPTTDASKFGEWTLPIIKKSIEGAKDIQNRDFIEIWSECPNCGKLVCAFHKDYKEEFVKLFDEKQIKFLKWDICQDCSNFLHEDDYRYDNILLGWCGAQNSDCIICNILKLYEKWQEKEENK